MFLIGKGGGGFRSPYLDIILKGRGEKLLAPGAYPAHDVRNEEALMIYECSFFNRNYWTPRGSLIITLNYLRFTGNQVTSTCKWGAIESIRNETWNREIYFDDRQVFSGRASGGCEEAYFKAKQKGIIFEFIDGSRWMFLDFFDQETASYFLRSFHKLQKDAWGVTRPFRIPFHRLYDSCLTRCFEPVTEYVTNLATEPPPQMLPARPVLLKPEPYTGDAWLQEIGGRTADVKAFVKPFVVESTRLDIVREHLAQDENSESTADQTPTVPRILAQEKKTTTAFSNHSSTTK